MTGLRTALAGILLAAGSSLPAAAQDAATSASADTATCSAFARANDKGEQVLRAVCGEGGVLIGPVDSFKAMGVGSSGAVLVDATRDGKRRLWLVSPDANGEPVLEEISGSVAMAAGRGTRQDLSGLAIDLSAVEKGGPVTVAAAGDAGVSSSRGVDVATIAGAARSMQRPVSGETQ